MISPVFMALFRDFITEYIDHVRYRVGTTWTDVAISDSSISIIDDKIRVQFNVSCSTESTVNRVELCDEDGYTLIGSDCDITIAAYQQILWWFDLTVTEATS